MVDLKYVKRKRFRAIVLFITSVSIILITPFFILPFIGKSIGRFTIGLKNFDVSLSLSDSKDFTDSYTIKTFDKLPPYLTYSNSFINKNYTDEYLDSEESNGKIGERINPETEEATALYFFKHTFYVKNTGNTFARYDIKFNIVENIRPTNVEYSLDDILRVRWYENEDDTHNYETFAKKEAKPALDENGEVTYDACVDAEIGKSYECINGHATQFSGDEQVFESSVSRFAPGQIRRYTLIIWLGGTDAQCDGTPPDNTLLKLAIDINAYEDSNEG